MSTQGWFLITLFAFILIVCILIAAFPRTRQVLRERRQNVFYEKARVFATGIRSQKEAVILAEIPIASAEPTTLIFNQPAATVLVPKAGTYNISYSVQLRWNKEATASVAVVCDDIATKTTLIGSQQQLTVAISSSQIVSHQFVAYLKKGSSLYIVSQASEIDSIVVPSSESASVLTPTTLAALTLTEI